MYYRGVFQQLVNRFPGAEIPVDITYPVHLYPELPLRPVLHFIKRQKTSHSDGFEYTVSRNFPTLSTVWRLFRWPARGVIVNEFTPLTVTTALFSKLRRRWVVLLIESNPTFRGGADGALSRRIKGLLARLADVVVVSNETTRRYALQRLRLPVKHVLTSPYLTSVPAQVDEAPTIAGPVRFLFLNTLQKRKGLHLLLEALSGIESPERKWILDVFGDGPERAALEAASKRLGLDDAVLFHGSVPYSAVGQCYASAHVVISPTLGDYRSLAGFEALNARRPVILSDRDGASAEIVESGAAATSLDPTDIHALREAIARFLRADDYLAESLRKAADPPAAFTFEAIGDNIEAAIRAAGRDRP